MAGLVLVIAIYFLSNLKDSRYTKLTVSRNQSPGFSVFSLSEPVTFYLLVETHPLKSRRCRSTHSYPPIPKELVIPAAAYHDFFPSLLRFYCNIYKKKRQSNLS